MKTTRRILALAIAVAVGLFSAHADPTGTSTWWTVNFDSGYINGGLITNSPTQANGVWTSTGDGTSIMTNDPLKSYTSNMGKISTGDGTLVWKPAQAGAPAALTRVLIDAKVYIVGSESLPSISGGTVQTEVFLTNSVAGETTTSYLCAHVGDGAGSKWIRITNPSVSIADQTWIDLRIEIDYLPAKPRLQFIVNSYVMASDGNEWFDVMPSGASQDTVTEVVFTGTGYIDNFVGQRVVTTVPIFSDGGDNTNAVPGTGSAISIAEVGNAVKATFSDGTKYIQMKGPDGFTQTARVTDGVASFSTTDLSAGTYTITAYYGDAPTVIPSSYKPAAEAAAGKKAAEVAGGNITLNVVPVSGLYYTLFAGNFDDGLKATAASKLATPADQDAGFLQIAMPVPATANEVKIIKIVASDDPYALNASVPVE